MSLVNRVSAFFLAALAVCLIGYSLTMYGLIREHLYHTFDEQLNGALNVLVAALEVEPDGVKWQPSDHTITLGNATAESEVRWIITNEQARIIDASANLADAPANDPLLLMAQAAGGPADVLRVMDGWRLIQHRMAAPMPKPPAERDLDEHAEVQVTVARRLGPLQSELFQLAIMACTLAIGLWLMAAFAGRAYCRRALRPVSEMALRARSMRTADFGLRLPRSDHPDELADLALSFNELLDRLQRAYQQQQRFTGDAAHQLRTPLTVLRGQIEVALRRPRTSEEYQSMLTQLGQQTRDLQQIVEALLFLARTEGGMALPDQQELALADWLPRYLEAWQTHPRRADLNLQLGRPASLVTSPPLLRQALDNLVSNALKYSPQGSPVTIATEVCNGGVEVSVTDRGCGIDPADVDSVFEPFFRSSAARRSGVAGTGLGLAIVRQIVEALGGSVKCESLPQQGSRFVLRLPLRKQDESGDSRS